MKSVSTLKRVLVSVSLMLALLLPLTAQATTATDIIVGAKTLPLLSDRPSGHVVLAVIYDPNSTASRADAEAAMADITHNNTVGDITYTGKMVPIGDLKQLQASGARAAFVMDGTRASMEDIYNAANAAHVLTMSSDIICVRAGKCTLGILTGGSSPIEIYYSEDAASAAKVGFVQAFLMLVKRV